MRLVEQSEVRKGRGRLPYALFLKRGRRSVRVGVDEELGVIVLGPLGVSRARIRRMLRKHFGGFQRALRREIELASWRRPRRFESGERFLYLGRWYRLAIEEGRARRGSGGEPSARLHRGRLVVRVARDWSPSTRARHIRAQIAEFYSLQTGMHLLARVHLWAAALNVEPPRLWMTRLGDAWAGCDPSSNLLVFDERVIQAPLRILDYVIVHELAHFFHRTHGRAFWARVATVMPDWAARDEALRRLEPAMRW